MTRDELKKRAIELRLHGYTYREICELLEMRVPKGTLSGWLSGIPMSRVAERRLTEAQQDAVKKNQRKAVLVNREKREEYLSRIRESNEYLVDMMEDKDTAKIALVMLYLGEGGKNPKAASVRFGNSSPYLICLFLKLLKKCYIIDEARFRCRIQHRADQKTEELVTFWSEITGVPKAQFYRSYVDTRTVGKVTQKIGYKGVCSIAYLSAPILLDILATGEILTGR